jgi:uncharacterized protein YneF (UPF0154 family)
MRKRHLAFWGAKRKDFIKATLLVLIVKAFVSPHTPPTAYLAVSFQAGLAILLFGFLKQKKLAVYLLAVISLMQSGLQKLLVLTFVFGNTLWDSIDMFARFVVKQFSMEFISLDTFSVSFSLVVGYLLIHLIGGIVIGFYSSSLAANIQSKVAANPPLTIPAKEMDLMQKKRVKRKGKVRIIYFVFPMALALFFASYLVPEVERSVGMSALIMIIRAVIILAAWYYFVGPFVKKYLLKFLHKKKISYKSDIDEIFVLIPVFRQIISAEWIRYKKDKSVGFKEMIRTIFLNILTIEIEKPNIQSGSINKTA